MPTSGKKVLSSSVKKDTKTATQPDGTIVDTITTTTTEKFEDGTTGVRTQVETITKTPGGAKGGPGAKGAKAPSAESPADSKAPKVTNTTDGKFIQMCLDQHNVLRAKHGAAKLTLNGDLGKIAQAWANELAKKGNMEHSTAGFGENVYWCTDPIDGKRPVDQWYSEIKDYNFSNLVGQKGCGHFTQVIWKASKEVGIAVAKGPKGFFVVANYNPPGNFIGMYPQNIQK